MTDITPLAIDSWAAPCSAQDQAAAVAALEAGNVLLLPQLDFPLHDNERGLYFQGAGVEVQGKNISLNLADHSVRGSSADAAELAVLRDMMVRFATLSRTLVHGLLPGYVATLEQGRTSFRPVEVAGRPSSWRQDDTRLHVDSFPSSPTRGKRILRLFTNVNPHGEGRHWRLGGSFEDVARRHLASLHGPLWGSRQLLAMLGITKGPRSAYDHFMLQLHDRMKADSDYQASADQRSCEFAPGSTWMVYTDQVPHAAMGGRFAFEQTFYLPVAGMRDPAHSPLRVLERLMGRELV
jgi:hypothetical protein